jgi:hypothetical protein
MSLRQILNIVYAMHVEDLDAEARQQFDAMLNEDPEEAGVNSRRATVQQRAEALGTAPAVISG